MQAFVADMLAKQHTDLHLVPHPTGRGEWSLINRVAEMEVELRNGIWRFPSIGGVLRDKEAEALLRDMKFFARVDHVPDRLVATVLAGWGLSREGKFKIEYFTRDFLVR